MTIKDILADLRNDILLGKINSGTFIRQQEIADRYGISRTPAREILNALEAEGLVDNLRNKGYKVKSFELKDLMEIIDVRMQMEGYAAGLAARNPSPEVIKKLKDLSNKIDKAEKCYKKTNSEKDLIEWSKLELEFHQTIIQATDNQLLIRLTQGINFQWISFMRDSIDNHKAPTHMDIAIAIEKGDVKNAKKLARKHLASYKRTTITKFAGNTVEFFE